MNPILCPVRNNLTYTKAALQSFRKQDIEVGVVFVVTSGEDNIASYLWTQYDVLALHRWGASVAQAWNNGLKWIFQHAEHCLVVNNDVELLPETYRMLLEDGGGFVTAVGVNTREQFKLDNPEVSRRPNPDFSCFLIRKEVWEKVGPFDENFKGAYCEDWDYHCRLHRAGITAYCIGVPFLHHASGTIKSLPLRLQRPIQEQAERNREYFFQKWGFRGGTPEYENFFKFPTSG